MKQSLFLVFVIALLITNVFPAYGQDNYVMVESLNLLEKSIEDSESSLKSNKGADLFNTETTFSKHGPALAILESQLGIFKEEVASLPEPGTDSGPDP